MVGEVVAGVNRPGVITFDPAAAVSDRQEGPMDRTHEEAVLRAQTQQAALFELLKSGVSTAGAALTATLAGAAKALPASARTVSPMIAVRIFLTPFPLLQVKPIH